eukprot:1184356-Prorocentrum_minimum.AAC.3
MSRDITSLSFKIQVSSTLSILERTGVASRHWSSFPSILSNPTPAKPRERVPEITIRGTDTQTSQFSRGNIRRGSHR